MIRVSTDRDTQCEITFATALCNQTFWGDSAKKMRRKIKCNAGSLNITLKNCQKDGCLNISGCIFILITCSSKFILQQFRAWFLCPTKTHILLLIRQSIYPTGVRIGNSHISYIHSHIIVCSVLLFDDFDNVSKHFPKTFHLMRMSANSANC